MNPPPGSPSGWRRLAAAAAFLSALAAGHPDRHEGYMAWPATAFEMTSGGAIDVDLDGEALEMDPRSAARNLGQIAAGRPVTSVQ